jgi:DivIVA domain-containing protein
LALDRQSIEKRDFPIARRGYDPAAVDEHLAIVAQEIVIIQRESGQRAGAGAGAESLASVASEQVRAIVEAAERSAAEIERQALDAARRVDEQARADADRARSEAIDRAEEHVGKVSQATHLMLQRVDAMESELGALIESLRTGANRLTADLALLEGNMSELYGAASVGTMPEGHYVDAEPFAMPEPPEPPEEEFRTQTESIGQPPDQEVATQAFDEPEPEPAAPTRISESPPADEGSSWPPAASPAGGSADAEGARLIALNMALNGQSREETDRYLAENFDLADRARLLDEVYSSLE